MTLPNICLIKIKILVNLIDRVRYRVDRFSDTNKNVKALLNGAHGTLPC